MPADVFRSMKGCVTGLASRSVFRDQSAGAVDQGSGRGAFDALLR